MSRSRSALPLVALPLAVLALAAPARAQTGPLPPPPPIAVSQSEPGFGPLAERRGALVSRQTAINKRRDDHNAVCMGIPASNTGQIAWCRSNAEAIGREKAAYGEQLKAYEANQLYYQGRTLYLRKDYDGAIHLYRQANATAGGANLFEVRIVDAIDMAEAARASALGDMEKANDHLCRIDDGGVFRNSWIAIDANQVFGRVRAWFMKRSRKFQVRTPAAVCGVRG